MIKHYKSLGKQQYDFLAGHAQYKQSLSTDVYSLKTLRLTKRNLRGTIIHLLRSLKQLFLKLKQKTKT
jgi:CelD/BcsL family acetyltransferase involved in cellulose biosynthesis